MDQYTKNDLNNFLDMLSGPIAFLLILGNIVFSFAFMPLTISYYNFMDGHLYAPLWLIGIIIAQVLLSKNTVRIKRGLFKNKRYYDNQVVETSAILINIVSAALLILNFYLFFTNYPFKKIFLIEMF